MSRPLSSEYSVQLGYSFNLRLGRNLELLKNAVINQDFDACILIDGKEGAGKSVLAQQIACFLDVENKLTMEQIVFSAEDFKKAVLGLKQFKAIVWDEARAGLNRRRSTEQVNIEITDMLAEARQLNLFMVIVMPSFYDMDRIAGVWRSRALVHVWYSWDTADRKHPLKRGFFRFYNEEGKKELYTNKYTREKYQYPFLKDCCFDATFPLHYVVDEEEYKKKKKLALRAFQSARNPLICPKCGVKAARGSKGVLKCRFGHEWNENEINNA